MLDYRRVYEKMHVVSALFLCRGTYSFLWTAWTCSVGLPLCLTLISTEMWSGLQLGLSVYTLLISESFCTLVVSPDPLTW